MTVYRQPFGYGEAELTEKRSRFIGRVWPVETEEDALLMLKETREKHRDATHNVYAYIIRDNNIMRYSDDGEPQGTSGMPTLTVFRSSEITNVCCVITRYFGGTLLGTGGLVRAYSQTAKLALEAAGIAVMREWDDVLISCPYNLFERVRNELPAFGGMIENTDYGADVLIEAGVPSENTAALSARLQDISAGTVKAERISGGFRGVREM